MAWSLLLDSAILDEVGEEVATAAISTAGSLWATFDVSIEAGGIAVPVLITPQLLVDVDTYASIIENDRVGPISIKNHVPPWNRVVFTIDTDGLEEARLLIALSRLGAGESVTVTVRGNSNG